LRRWRKPRCDVTPNRGGRCVGSGAPGRREGLFQQIEDCRARNKDVDPQQIEADVEEAAKATGRDRGNRGIAFQEIAEMILNGDYIDLLENPARPDQDIVVLAIHGYTWVVPFLVDGNTLFLKTAYPSRKFHRRYGGRDAE